MTVAQIIAQQIGHKALFMIGASKSLSSGKDFLMMKLGRNQKGWNKLKIALNGLDLYDMTFYRITKDRLGIPSIAKERTIANIYADMMHDIIESETGLRTSL